MMTIQEMVKMRFDSNRLSKVTDETRKWVIRTEVILGTRRIRFAGRWDEAKRQGWLDPEFATDIEKYQIRWYEFSLKADFENALKVLIEKGYEK